MKGRSAANAIYTQSRQTVETFADKMWLGFGDARRYPTISPTAASSMFAPRPWGKVRMTDETSALWLDVSWKNYEKLMFLFGKYILQPGTASMSEQKMCLVPEAQHWHFALELLQSDFFPNAESPDKSLKEVVQNLCAESSSSVHTEKGSYLWQRRRCWSHLKSFEVLQCLTFAFQGLARTSSLSPGLFVHAKPGCA